MSRYEIAIFFGAYIFFFPFLFFYGKTGSKAVRIILSALPLCFLSMIVFLWGGHMLRVGSLCDAGFMYVGAASRTTPYLSNLQAEAPTYFAFMRFLLNRGDGSLRQYQNIVGILNWCFGAAIAVSLILAVNYYFKKGRLSPVGLVSLASIVIIGLLPFMRNVELGNTNIWVGGLVALHLSAVRLSKKVGVRFLGGAALGLAFMVKPYLLLVLIFLLFTAARKRNWSAFGGVVATCALGFLASLLVEGIDLTTYYDFVSHAPATLYYHSKNLYSVNLSLLKYAPLEAVGTINILGILLFGIVALIVSKNPESDGLPWFFVALLPFPIMWEEHLMGIYPAFFFSVLEKEKPKQLMMAATVVTLIFFSSVIKIPLIPNISLLILWAWELRTEFHMRQAAAVNVVLGASAVSSRAEE